MIWQAVADLGKEAHRADAQRFFDGSWFDEYCDVLGWNARRARASLHRFVHGGGRISGNHLLSAGTSRPLGAAG